MTMMGVNPQTGEIQDDDEWFGVPAARPVAARIPPSGASTLELLSSDLSEHAAAFDEALEDEELAENAFHHAASIAVIKYANDVPATILNQYVKAHCDTELARWTSSRVATKRARVRWQTTQHNQMAEMARLKYSGASDGGR